MNFINGAWSKSIDPTGELRSISPADLKKELGRFPFSYKSVDDAVGAAGAAFSTWRKQSIAERKSILLRYRDALLQNESKLVETIALEVGKPLWEAKQEVAAMISKIDVTINEGLSFFQDYVIQNALDQTAGICRFRPLGVVAVLAPFNFPGLISNGHIVSALISGNTVVFKPSERTPATGELLAEAFRTAGAAPGVFNLIQGDREVGRRLAVNERVDAILFTGSYETGLQIKTATVQQHSKLLVLHMGAKNPAIVHEDADLEWAIRETLVGAYLTTGQRCSSTSRILVQQKLLDAFIDGFHKRAKKFLIGHPNQNPFMGPLIGQDAVEKYLKFVGIAQREGCELIMRGKVLETEWPGYYVTPSICLARNNTLSQVKKSVYQQTEIFGPNVVIVPYSTIEDAVALANASHYGLVCSVFTANRDIFQEIYQNANFGLINWNRSTVGASSRLPFGGIRRSGNHRPGGILSASHCALPVASLELQNVAEMGQGVRSGEENIPGLNGGSELV